MVTVSHEIGDMEKNKKHIQYSNIWCEFGVIGHMT